MPILTRGLSCETTDSISLLPIFDIGSINIVEELGANYYQYYIEKKPGVDWVNITSLPGFMRTTLDKLKAKVDLPRIPGLNPALCCCMYHGLPIIQANRHIKDLLAAKQRFEEMEQQGSPREEFISQYFRSSLDVGIESGKRQNVAVPGELKKSIAGLAINTGISESALGVLSAMAILAKQPGVAENYRKQFSDKVEQLYSLVEMKVIGAEAMVAAL